MVKRIILMSLISALAVALLVQDLDPRGGFDLSQDWLAGRALLSGDDAYKAKAAIMRDHRDGPVRAPDVRNGTAHPPVHVILLAPLSLLPFSQARLIWLALSALFLFLAMWIFLDRYRLPRWLALVPFILPFVHSEFIVGQSSCLLLLMFVMAENRRSLLGLAAAIKVYPVILLVRRDVPRLAVLAVGGAVTMAATLIISVSGVWRWLTMIQTENLRVAMAHTSNMSLASLLLQVGIPYGIGIPVAILAALPLLRRARYYDALPILVLATPLAWPHYGVLCLPAMIHRGQTGLALAAALSLTATMPTLGWVGGLALVAFVATTPTASKSHSSGVWPEALAETGRRPQAI